MSFFDFLLNSEDKEYRKLNEEAYLEEKAIRRQFKDNKNIFQYMGAKIKHWWNCTISF